MSNDGNRIVVGIDNVANNSFTTQPLEWNTTHWIPMLSSSSSPIRHNQQIINNNFTDLVYYSSNRYVTMAPNGGNRIAVYNPPIFNATISSFSNNYVAFASSIQVWEWNTTTTTTNTNTNTNQWNPMGGNILEQIKKDQFHSTTGEEWALQMSLSNNGEIIAIFYLQGVYVFQWSEAEAAAAGDDNGVGEWKQMGQMITSDYEGGRLQMALAANGQHVVMGDGFYTKPPYRVWDQWKGRVQVFQYNPEQNMWIQLGRRSRSRDDGNNNGNGFDLEGTQVNGLFGAAVDISADGTRIAVGADGYRTNSRFVRVYEYKTSKGTTIQRIFDRIKNVFYSWKNRLGGGKYL